MTQEVRDADGEISGHSHIEGAISGMHGMAVLSESYVSDVEE